MLDGVLKTRGSHLGVLRRLGPFVVVGAPVGRTRRRRVQLVRLLGLGEDALDFRPLLALLDPREHVEVLELLVGAGFARTIASVVKFPFIYHGSFFCCFEHDL